MKFALENEKCGISYWELVDKINDVTGLNMGIEAEMSFADWFKDNFYFIHGSAHLIKVSSIKAIRESSYKEPPVSGGDIDTVAAKEQLEKKFFLKGLAAKQYQDYLELVEARRTARNSITIAVFSIVIAILALIINTYFSYKEYKKPTVIQSETSISSNKTDLYPTEILPDTVSKDSVQIQLDSTINKQ